jgi:hypothetical protein
MPSRVLSLAVLLAASSALSGCYRLATPGAPRDVVHDPDSPRRLDTYWWGIQQDDGLGATCRAYPGGIAEVTARTTPLYALITAVTIGIWAPVEIDAWCLGEKAAHERQ